MRKKVSRPLSEVAPRVDQKSWIDLERLAQVEITSEDAAHPIESALVSGQGLGWRAAEPGDQTLRILFDEPQRLRRIQLVFEEHEKARTQELVLRWSADRGRTYREIVRQQYNFGPPGTARQDEDYRVELEGVTALELHVVPDVSGGDSRASLTMLRLG
jgi:hypothetical protein